MQLSQIGIDFDIHKMIEAERRSFDEPHYLALRRLLKLPEVKEDERAHSQPEEGVAWTEEGVVIPHGSFARMKYQRGSQIYEGKFLNGELVVNGKGYPTLSAAATDLGVTKKGEKTSLNGWLYWQVKLPGADRWTHLSALRKAKRGSPRR